MFLSHQNIEECINTGAIIIGPDFDKKNIRPVGVRIHLGPSLLIAQPGQTIDLTTSAHLEYKEIDLATEEFYLEPGQFVLGSTYETIQTAPNILAMLDGRSTIARLGLTVHVTASVIDGTFEGPHSAVLEIKNLGDFRIRLKFKDPVAMMLFVELKDPVVQKLQSQYSQTSNKVVAPNLGFKTGSDK